MNALKAHVTHHRKHMIGCGIAGSGLAIGIILRIPVLAVTAGIVCGVLCLSMLRMMIKMGLESQHH